VDYLGYGSIGRPSPWGTIRWNPRIPAPAGLKGVAPSLVVEEIDLHSQPLLEKWRFFNISKYAGPVKVFALKEFHNFAHTITAAQVHCAPSTGYLLRSVICLQPMARPLAFMLRWRSPPNILSVNSPVWLSNVAMLCCFACRSTPTISSRPPSPEPFWVGTAKSTRVSRGDVLMSSVIQK